MEFHQYFIPTVLSLYLVILGACRGECNPGRDAHTDVIGTPYFFFQQPSYPRDCKDILRQCSANTTSDVYVIKPDGYNDAFEAYCDNDVDGGGWTVIQRWIDGSLDFQRVWSEYKTGFGFLQNEFWLGLEKLSFLTNQKDYKIRIDMENSVGSSFYIEYNLFRVSDEWSDYKLAVLGHYSGTADDFLVSCPLNMEYGNSSCQATCEDPLISLGCNNTRKDEEVCICRAGFLKKGDHCVPPEECSCFMEYEGVIPNGQTYISSDCTRRCECQSNILTCDDNYRCSSDATCEERDGVRQCYCNDGYTGDGQNCEVVATDCADIYNAYITDSGVYTIKPTNWNESAFEVYCNMTDGGGWTVFQRRMDGSENFYLGWNSYKEGFGTPNHELWLGNDKIYYLTNGKNYQLRIDLVERGGTPYYAKYDLFRIADENDNYRLVGLGSYTGNTGYDAMDFHRNRPFSTFDRDNDGWGDYNCAEREVGAWWYGEISWSISTGSHCKTSSVWCHHWPVGSNSCGSCSHSNLNGDYDGSTRGTNIHWAGNGLSGYECNIRFTEMKIRPV